MPRTVATPTKSAPKTPKSAPKNVRFNNDESDSDSSPIPSNFSSAKLFERQSFRMGLEEMLQQMNLGTPATGASNVNIEKLVSILLEQKPKTESQIRDCIAQATSGSSKKGKSTKTSKPKPPAKEPKVKKDFELVKFPDSVKPGKKVSFLPVENYKGLPSLAVLIFAADVPDAKIKQYLEGFEKDYPEYKPRSETVYGTHKGIIFKRLPLNAPKNSKNPDDVITFDAQDGDSKDTLRMRCRPLSELYDSLISKGTIALRTHKKLLDDGNLIVKNDKQKEEEDPETDDESESNNQKKGDFLAHHDSDDEIDANSSVQEEENEPEKPVIQSVVHRRKKEEQQPLDEEPEKPPTTVQRRRKAQPPPPESDDDVDVESGDDLDLDI